MKVQEFTIIASGLHPVRHDIIGLFNEAGCDDASVSVQKSLLIIAFAREASTFADAIISAFANVSSTGARVERFEPDDIVNLTDIAKRSGLSRPAITHYYNGARSFGTFPTPVARVTSESPLWDWLAVAEWLHAYKKVDGEVLAQARIIKKANAVVNSPNLSSDRFRAAVEQD